MREKRKVSPRALSDLDLDPGKTILTLSFFLTSHVIRHWIANPAGGLTADWSARPRSASVEPPAILTCAWTRSTPYFFIRLIFFFFLRWKKKR